MSKVTVGVIQMHSGSDSSVNLERALFLCEEACAAGAKWLVLPEVFFYRGEQKKGDAIPGPSTLPLMDFAKQQQVWIVAGSILETRPESNRCFNSSVVIDPNGEIAGIYRKIHLFDCEVDGKQMGESESMMPGDQPVLVTLDQISIGLSICYDLRFPELFRHYSLHGAQVLMVPSSFSYPTGEAHWETLIRARAIENLCYVVAPNQCGIGAKGVATFGNSMIVSPRGEVLARLDDKSEGVAVATLDFRAQAELRDRFPVLSHRRL